MVNLQSNPYWNYDVTYGDKYGVPPALLSAQEYAESGWNPAAISPTGAIGIAQFEPATAQSYGVNPYSPKSSIQGEAEMMSQLHKLFGSWDLALAGYNAGPGAVEAAGDSIPNNGQTPGYVNEINQLLSTSNLKKDFANSTHTVSPGSEPTDTTSGQESSVTIAKLPLFGNVTMSYAVIVRGLLYIVGIVLVVEGLRIAFTNKKQSIVINDVLPAGKKQVKSYRKKRAQRRKQESKNKKTAVKAAVEAAAEDAVTA